jgi:hypothetical protein
VVTTEQLIAAIAPENRIGACFARIVRFDAIDLGQPQAGTSREAQALHCAGKAALRRSGVLDVPASQALCNRSREGALVRVCSFSELSEANHVVAGLRAPEACQNNRGVEASGEAKENASAGGSPRMGAKLRRSFQGARG